MVGANEGVKLNCTMLRLLISPEPVHLLHVVQGDHAISQNNVQQTIGAK